MAAMNISPISLLTPPDFSTVNVITDHPKPITFRPKRKPSSICLATSSPEPSAALEKAVIEVEFIGPKEGADGKYPVEKATAISGEKLLRNIMLDNKIELYATYGKVMNCGGGGSCGTCIVEIIDGRDLLNERTNTELRYLKKKSFCAEARVLEIGLPNNRWKQRKCWKGSGPEIASMEKVTRVEEIICLACCSRYSIIRSSCGMSWKFSSFIVISGGKGGSYKTKAMLYLSRLQNEEASDFIRPTETVDYYYTVFQHMIAEGYLFPGSKALCIGSISGHDVIGLRKIGVIDAIGVSEAEFRASHQDVGHPFGNSSFDFEFVGYRSWFNWSSHPSEIVSQICRTLKVGGYLVVHIVVKDEYSYHSFINLFTCCTLVVSREIRTPEGFAIPSLYETILKKERKYSSHSGSYKCMVPEYKGKLINKIEPLMMEEPRDSWNALGRNENSIQYLSALVDLSFKERYIYVDIGSRDSGSSIGSWFERYYPKQNKTFEIYAVEADESFHEEYKRKMGVTLLPSAAWVRNETLLFEINREPTDAEQRWEQMGRIQPEQSSSKHKDYVNRVDKVEALDLSDWLIRSVSDRDFVVVKMDVEGAEVDLMKSLVETGAICLMDELFLECHYDRWVKCCSGEGVERRKMEYAECVSLLDKLRRDGCFVHQWW